jgi:type II secretory pathway component PulK
MYWLRKLTLARMSSNDVNTHLKEMSQYFENLNSLVSNNKPLTLDDI